MTPAEAIKALDDALDTSGQNITLRKGNSTVGQVSVKAIVRGVSADDIVGNITQSHKKVSVSPTGLDVFGLPGASTIVVHGDGQGAVEGKPEVVRMDDVVVRINMVIKG